MHIFCNYVFIILQDFESIDLLPFHHSSLFAFLTGKCHFLFLFKLNILLFTIYFDMLWYAYLPSFFNINMLVSISYGIPAVKLLRQNCPVFLVGIFVNTG